MSALIGFCLGILVPLALFLLFHPTIDGWLDDFWERQVRRRRDRR